MKTQYFMYLKILAMFFGILLISLSWWTTSIIGFLICLIVGVYNLYLAEYFNKRMRGL